MLRTMMIAAVLAGCAATAQAQTAGGPATSSPGAMPTQTPLGSAPGSPPPSASDAGTTTKAPTTTHPAEAVSPNGTVSPAKTK